MKDIYFITTDQSLMDKTVVALSKNSSGIIEILDIIHSDKKLSPDLYSKYICQPYKNEDEALKGFNMLKEMLNFNINTDEDGNVYYQSLI